MDKLIVFALGTVIGGGLLRLVTHGVYLMIIGGLITYIVVHK